MTKQQVFEIFKIEDLNDLPDAIMKVLEGDRITAIAVYDELLAANNYDLSKDWFQEVYEEALSERGQKKQDFTPHSVSNLASLITGNKKGAIHEPTAGNGSMIIADWWNRCKSTLPWYHKPSENLVNCWELSNRSIPILLLNLSIRGIMGYVYHGDVLEQKVKAKYILLNRNDDTLSFSDIIFDVDNNLKIYQNEIQGNSSQVG